VHIFIPILMICENFISQGNVVTQLKCGGMFNNRNIANFPQNASMKEFLKSININKNIFAKDWWHVFTVYNVHRESKKTPNSDKYWRIFHFSPIDSLGNFQQNVRYRFTRCRRVAEQCTLLDQIFTQFNIQFIDACCLLQCIFRLFSFSQVAQKQTLGEAGTWTVSCVRNIITKKLLKSDNLT